MPRPVSHSPSSQLANTEQQITVLQAEAEGKREELQVAGKETLSEAATVLEPLGARDLEPLTRATDGPVFGIFQGARFFRHVSCLESQVSNIFKIF